MRKTVVIIAAIAIIGLLGIEAKAKKSDTPSLVPTSSQSSGQTSPATKASSTNPTSYKDGTYTGNAQDTPYGAVQIATVVSSGKITDIKFLQMPNDMGHSAELSRFSEPLLKQTAINSQNASSIDFVSGATSTSEGFQSSLQSALDQAAINSSNASNT